MFTIIAKNYLPFARVLMASLRAVAPDIQRIVVLADRLDGNFDPKAEDFEIILSEDLAIPHSRWFHFKYTILELSTALKPYAVEEIFGRYGVERLLYFDPDIAIYSGVEEILAALDSNSIILTPHLTAPLEDGRRPSDLDIMRSGTYNLGFIGMRNSPETLRFIRWWQEKLYDHCVVDLSKGLFVDQRWIDLVPGLFEGVGILRDPGLNVAYWNIAQRPIARTSDGYTVKGRPLCFFHFSGFDPDNPYGFSRHQDRFTLDDLGDAKELILDYRLRLLKNGYATCKSWPYAFGVFDNGSPIPEVGRPTHHEAPELVAQFEDPFSDEGYRAFLDLWNSPLTGADGEPTGVTRLAYRIYQSRSDVQAAMPDIFNGNLLPFMNWVVSSARVEHHLSDVFIAPIWEAIRVRNKDTSRPASGNPKISEAVVQKLANNGVWVSGSAPVQIDALNELIENGAAKFHLSHLARAIYESRPDLQRFFPDPAGRDGMRFIAWFLTYGAREYRLAEVFLEPLRTQWETVVRSLKNPVKRSWYRLVYSAMAGSMTARARVTRILSGVRFAKFRHRQKNRNAAPVREGINLIGYLQAEMSTGEGVRCSARAAHASQLPVALKGIPLLGPYRQNDASLGPEDSRWPYSVNLFHVNADQSDQIFRKVGRTLTYGRYNIGYWAWELEDFPDKWSRAFQNLDEIWTPSSFCQSAIARKSPIPIIRMPHPIALEECAPLDRAALSSTPHEFVFLTIFDVLSIVERKNPFAVVKAFRAAFNGSPGFRLVMKVNHADQKPTEMHHLREAAAGLPVTFLDRTMDRAQLNALIQTSDCMVSLHRSEGFGLTLAEAMYFGKPTIATAYSGNLDFTRPDNSFLVDYTLVPVPHGCDPYEPGRLWADPDIEHAAAQMRLAATDEKLRSDRAQRGQAFVRSNFSAEAVGNLMKERLQVVRKGRTDR